MEANQEYVGRQERRTDTLDRHRVADLAALLDVDFETIAPGNALPPLAHWFYFNTWAKESQLGTDGHPRRGGFMPPITLPRRMFAGGRITFHRDLQLGTPAERMATIVSIKNKTGSSGELIFVTVKHEISDGQGLAIEEEQDIVFRDAPRSGSPAQVQSAPETAPPLEPGSIVKRINVDPVMLFRFSALTSNTHRIHYDRPYAMEVESYPGLVVHGPLQAMFLTDLAREKFGKRIASFSFQARKPIFDTAPFDCVARRTDSGVELMTIDTASQPCMKASALLT